MPRRKGNRELKPRQTQRDRKLWRPMGSTRKLYRNSVPRTLQIATRRNKSQRLRFVVNHIYEFNPGTTDGTETNGFVYRANSIYDIRPGQNGNLANFEAQSTAYSTATTNITADGWNEWTERYQHFTVLGSKCQATFEPYGIEDDNYKEPGMLSIVLSGTNNAVQASTDSSGINTLPYMKKVNIMPGSALNRGGRIYQFYSARKFEGVNDVNDNSNLRGRFQNPTQNAGAPSENSFFYINLSKLNPAQAKQMPKGMLTVKIEYIVNLSEPTQSNDVQEVASIHNISSLP